MQVAVIGAGPSGLAAIKELLEENHDVTCFEKAADLGGVFRFDEHGGGVHESAQLTSSVFVTCFSDFTPPKNAPLHFPHAQYLQYLRGYAAHFKLLELIQFGKIVEHAELNPNGKWRLKVVDQSNQRQTELEFDALAVCAGTHQNPFIPSLPGKETFQGQILHSCSYKRPAPFKDKKVVVVGAAESASDIVEEISQVTKQCFLSLRRGTVVTPRLLFGDPADYFNNRLFYSISKWFYKLRSPQGVDLPSAVLVLLSLPAFLLPLLAAAIALSRLSVLIPAMTLVIIAFSLAFMGWMIFQAIRFITVEVTPKEAGILTKLFKDSSGDEGEQFLTKTLGAVRAIAKGLCTLKPKIRELSGSSVIFDDGTSAEADAIIFCTGFTTLMPFLGRQSLDLRSLYKNCFDAALGPTLCFIGLARPAIGAIPPIAEMQARWFAQVLSGGCQLPSRIIMQQEILKDKQWHERQFKTISSRITGLVLFAPYLDELAEFIGCKPRWKDLIKQPALLYRVYCQPFSIHQYRLSGLHSNKKAASIALKRLRIRPMRLIYNYGLFSVAATAEALYRLGLRLFKPGLRL